MYNVYIDIDITGLETAAALRCIRPGGTDESGIGNISDERSFSFFFSVVFVFIFIL